MTGPAPSSGDTLGSRWDVGAGGGQAHRGHTRINLHWGGELQEGDVIVEVVGVVVRVTDGLCREMTTKSYPVVCDLISV